MARRVSANAVDLVDSRRCDLTTGIFESGRLTLMFDVVAWGRERSSRTGGKSSDT